MNFVHSQKFKMTQEEIKLLINKLEDENKNLEFTRVMSSSFDRQIAADINFNNGQMYILRKLLND